MEIVIGILIFLGAMVAMNKLGLGCCGGRRGNSDHKEESGNKSCCSSKTKKII